MAAAAGDGALGRDFVCARAEVVQVDLGWDGSSLRGIATTGAEALTALTLLTRPWKGRSSTVLHGLEVFGSSREAAPFPKPVKTAGLALLTPTEPDRLTVASGPRRPGSPGRNRREVAARRAVRSGARERRR